MYFRSRKKRESCWTSCPNSWKNSNTEKLCKHTAQSMMAIFPTFFSHCFGKILSKYLTFQCLSHHFLGFNWQTEFQINCLRVQNHIFFIYCVMALSSNWGCSFFLHPSQLSWSMWKTGRKAPVWFISGQLTEIQTACDWRGHETNTVEGAP